MPDHTLRIKIAKPGKELKRIHAVLTVIQGREIGRDYRLRQREYTIGRDPDCDISISEETASRRHASIQLKYAKDGRPSEYRLIDKGSTNKTFVNNREEQSVLLDDGDKIRIGNLRRARGGAFTWPGTIYAAGYFSLCPVFISANTRTFERSSSLYIPPESTASTLKFALGVFLYGVNLALVGAVIVLYRRQARTI